MDPRLNTKGPTLIILAEHKAPVYDKTGIKLITSTFRRPTGEVLDPRIHHNNLLNSILAKIQANAAGADDALMLDSRGFIAETNATHVFFVRGNEIMTPFTHACPEGITRGAVLDLCGQHRIPYEIRDISIAEAYRADEMFCTGTMGEIAPVLELDGRKIGAGNSGPVTLDLCDLFKRMVEREGDKVL
jgi:branched-chain amino acid aminotransferase